MLCRLPSTTLFPYSTLFRSCLKRILIVADAEALIGGQARLFANFIFARWRHFRLLAHWIVNLLLIFNSNRSFVSPVVLDRKSTRLNSSHGYMSYSVFFLKKKRRGRRDARAGPRSGVARTRGHPASGGRSIGTPGRRDAQQRCSGRAGSAGTQAAHERARH